MINYIYSSQGINKKTFKRYIKYNLAVNGYNSDNLKIELSFDFNAVDCMFKYNSEKYYLQFTTLPYNHDTIYALNYNSMRLSYHLLKSMFSPFGFANILSPKKLCEYSKQIYDNLYITELYDELNYIKDINVKNYPDVRETDFHVPLHYYIDYFLKVDVNYNINVIKCVNFSYAILYNILDENSINTKTIELQESMKVPFLYTYYSNAYPYKLGKEKTIYTFNTVMDNIIFDIRILGI